MFYYVTYTLSDGSSTRLDAADENNARNLFDEAVNWPGTVYAHYATVFGERINWYCKPE